MALMSDYPPDLPLLPLPAAELRPFLYAVQDDPDDDLPRRALADYLEEVSDARAVLVRDSMAGDLTPLNRWLARYAQRWWGDLPEGMQITTRWGLLELTWPAGLFAAGEHAIPAGVRELLEQGWVFRVTLEGATEGEIPAWAADLFQTVTALRWKQATNGPLSCLPELERLRELDLSESPAVTAAGLAGVYRLPGLRDLHLRGCPGLAALTLADLPGLRSLHLAWCPNLTYLSLINLPELRALGLGMADRLATLRLHGVPALEELSLRACGPLTDTGLAQLSGLTGLQSLDLARCPGLTGAGLLHLSTLDNLRRLDLSECAALTRVRLREMPALEWLDLGGCSALAEVHLADLPRLERIDLSLSPNVTRVEMSGLPALGAVPVSRCSRLQNIGLADLTAVRSLDLSRLPALSSVALTGLTGLARLDLSGCRALAGLLLERLDGLRKLQLHGSRRLSGATLEGLSGLPALAELTLPNHIAERVVAALAARWPRCKVTREK
jgi:uncharacterized protein (TIGR02996 family)